MFYLTLVTGFWEQFKKLSSDLYFWDAEKTNDEKLGTGIYG